MAIEVEIVLNDGTLVKGLIKAEEKAKETGKKIGEDLGGGAEKAGNIISTKLVAAVAAVGAAVLSARSLIGFFEDAIEEASQTDEAVNRLNIALAQTGKFSVEAAASMQEYADQLQETTKFSDDMVLNTSALIQTLGALSQDQLKQATQAALDFATVMKIDVNTAATLVGKAANGNIEAFSRYGIKLKSTGDSVKDFANVLGVLESRFGGASQAATKTFEGAFTQLKNTFNDFLKSVGVFITRSPAIVATFNAVSDFIKNMTKGIQGFGSQDIFKGIITNFGIVAQAGILTFNQIGKTVEQLIARVNQAGAAIRVLLTAGFSERQNQLLASAIEQVKQVDQEFANLDQGPAIKFFDDLILRVQSTNGQLIDLNTNVNNITANLPTVQATFGAFMQGIADQFKFPQEAIALTQQQATFAAETMQQDFKAIADSAKATLARGVGQAFAAFGAALVKGENALEAFTKAFLQSIAQGAVALGTEFILRGVAYAFIPGLQGLSGPLIAAGAALAAFGGALGAAVGGGGGGGAGETAGGGGGGVTSQPSTATELPPDGQQVKQGPSVNVNVYGNVLDRRQTGLELAEVIQETFGSNAVVFST